MLSSPLIISCIIVFISLFSIILNYNLNIIEQIYVYTTILVIISIINIKYFDVKNKYILITPHILYTALVILGPFIIFNNYLLLLLLFSILFTIFTRYYYGICLFNKMDGKSASHLMPLNSDKLFLILLLLTILRLMGIIDD